MTFKQDQYVVVTNVPEITDGIVVKVCGKLKSPHYIVALPHNIRSPQGYTHMVLDENLLQALEFHQTEGSK